MVFCKPSKEEGAGNKVSASGDSEMKEGDPMKSEPDTQVKGEDAETDSAKHSEEQNGNSVKSEADEPTLVCRVLSGEEEQKLWERILEQRDKRQMNRKGKHGYSGQVNH